MYRLLTLDARIIIPKFKGIDSELNLNTNNRKKRGIFSIITGLAYLVLEGISAYLKKDKAIENR